MATHSCILARRIPWTEEPGGIQSWGCKESDMAEQLNNKAGDQCIWPMDDPDAECLGSLVGKRLEVLEKDSRVCVCVYVYRGQVEGIKDLETLSSCATLANF